MIIKWGRPEHSHCIQPYTWKQVLTKVNGIRTPHKTGGLGKRLEPDGYESWLCLLDHACGDPSFCWVYHETNKVFTPWGTNSELKLFKPSN